MRNLLYVGTALAIILPGASFAQTVPQEQSAEAPQSDDEASAEKDIVVTAQRRSERLQDVPISISAFDSTAIRDRNINTLQDLARIVPTFKGGFSVGVSSARLSLRGLGSLSNNAIEPSVATFVDGVYIARAGSINATLVDLDGIEVLSGPQGTLFGRNASVGAVNIRTGQPSDILEGRAAVEAGTGNRYRAEGVINVPLGEETAVRVSGLAELNDGYWKTLDGKGNGLDVFAGRVAFKTALSETLKWTLRGDYSLTRGTGWPNYAFLPDALTPAGETALRSRLNGQLPDTDISDNTTNVNFDDYSLRSTHGGVSSNLSWEFGNGFNLQLINSYRLWRDTENTDGGMALPLGNVLGRTIFWRSESHSHELQLNSPSEGLLDGRLNFVSGLFYYEEDFTQNADLNLGANYCLILVSAAQRPACQATANPNASYYFQQHTKSVAGYVQASFKIVPQLELTLGGRYTHDSKDATFLGRNNNTIAAALQTVETTDLDYGQGRKTYRVNLAWRPTDDLMLFGTVSTGFKSGGFNSGNAAVVLGQQRIFRPEMVTNYELGFKFQTPDRFLTFNATGFRMDVDDYQERSLVGPFATIRNVGSLRQSGIEFDGTLRFSRYFKLNAAGAYLKSKFLSYPNAPAIPGFGGTQDLSGRPLTFSPKFAGSVGGEVGMPLPGDKRISLRSDLYVTKKYFAGAAIDGNRFSIEPGYALLSARLTLFGPSDRWSIAAFGDNLTDKRYCALRSYQFLAAGLGIVNNTTGTPFRCFAAPPRTIGLRTEIKF